jgi:hypothetical protein
MVREQVVPTITTIELHSQPTQVNKLQYQFTPKHHGCGDSGDACWRTELSREREFGVFDDADQHQTNDDDGNLYGVAHDADNRELILLGTFSQQVAMFPVQRDGEPWHGYPLWALNELAPDNRRGEKMRPPKVVFNRLRSAGRITKRQYARLMKGDEA